jgi:hypothetical protein
MGMILPCYFFVYPLLIEVLPLKNEMSMKLNSRVQERHQNSVGIAINNDNICPKYAILNGNYR